MNKTNFVTFRFTDNDFHDPLRQAVTYVADRFKNLDEVTWKQYVVDAMVAYDMLRSVGRDSPQLNFKEYIEKYLTVKEVSNFKHNENFEGYVFNKHTYEVFYFSTY